MFVPRSLLLTLCLLATPVLAQPQDIAAIAVAPNAALEAQTARELNSMASVIASRPMGIVNEGDKRNLALAFAQLGRLDAGVRLANALEDQDPVGIYSAPLTLDEVRNLVARRRAVLGKVAEANQLVGAIKNPTLRAGALLSIARAQIRTGAKSEAQQTLFQALKLVEKERSAQIYIAVLLDRAAEHAAAKRLLTRVEKALPPFVPVKPLPGRTIDELRINGDWNHLAWALFQTGEEEKAAHIIFTTQGSYSSSLLMALIRRGNAAIAEKLARQSKEEIRQLMHLTGVAWGIRKTNPEHANALSQEIIERLQKLPVEPESNFKHSSTPSAGDAHIVFTAALRRDLGHEDEANTLLKEVTDRATSKAAAFARLMFALAPFTFEHNTRGDDSNAPRYTRDQIERISQEVNAAIPSANVNQFNSILPAFVEAQIEVGAVNFARQTIGLLEAKMLSNTPLPENDDPDELNPPLELARSMKKLGAKQVASNFLNQLWSSPAAKNIKPRYRAWKFIANGFVTEGRARLKSLGVGPQERIYQYSSLAYFEAKQKPATFPDWLNTVRDPHKKVWMLCDYSQGLTEYLFEDPTEREFTLTAGGSGFSISY